MKCELRGCEKPALERPDRPPMEARYCQGHEDEITQAIRDGNVRKIVSMAASAVLTRHFPDSRAEEDLRR